MPVITSRKKSGDIFKHIYDPTICLTSGIFRSGAGIIPAGTSLVGQPVKLSATKWVPVVSGDEANATGWMFSDVFLGDGLAANTDYTRSKVAILTLGPAIILEDALPTLDVVGGALVLATLKTAFATVDKHIKFVVDPPTVERIYVNT